MKRSDRGNCDPMSSEVYAVNKCPVAAVCGLYGFGILGALMLCQSAFWLVGCVWFYTMKGHNLLQTGVEFALATFWFIVAMLCHRGFDYCRDTLQRHKLPK